MAIGPTTAPAADDSPSIPAGAEKEWPSTSARYWALAVIIFATFVTFFDQVVFGMLAERIKADFGLSDAQLGFLAGPASIICYLFVGIPLARLADIWPRKYVLAGGVAVVGLVTALGGIAQTFAQFVGSRVFLAAGGSAHAPSSYSLLADAFPPRIITRAFALLQFGFIGGTTLGPVIGGMLIMMTANWEPTVIGPLRILGWQWILIWIALPAFVAALLFLTVKEPQRQAPVADVEQPPANAGLGRQIVTFMGFDAARAIHANRKVYYPLFGALALAATESFGLAFWRVPFMIRTFGWNEAEIGAAIGGTMLIGSLAGLLLGGLLVEFLAKRHKDANVRAAFICFLGTTVSTLVALLSPNGWGSMIAFGFAGMFGLAGAVPQNAAVQRVAPNSMRGQVTAFYLFMFTFFGAMGSFVIGLVAQYVVGDPAKLQHALVMTAGVLLPLACLLMLRAIRPYREEVERLEALGR
ncbi:MFS transporter [Novosphingobium arvoryzae]|uniref:MFS transporter n=1 Tax=Novosphingobium arvoryzae TaxID=1256514 RepID=A0A918VJZ1_9SPHN|nr:MFS transporter [Novosphingobium arvoryzae]GHA01990.1 MFS transporter [Novosphingobium arvoryzae]